MLPFKNIKVSVERRQFIKTVGLISATSLLIPSVVQSEQNTPAKYIPQALNQREISILNVIMSRIIPADAESGGAREARAYVYVDRALKSVYQSHLTAYQQGLAVLEMLAKQQGVASIELLSAAKIDTMITRLEKGDIKGTIKLDDKTETVLKNGGKHFFSLLLKHTLEGTFSDPMYGGNQDFVGWKILGFPGVQLFFSEESQAINGDDNNSNRSAADFGASPLF